MSTSSSPANRDGNVRRYFRLVLSSPERGTLIEKDFDVKHLFDDVVRVLVSNMITDGVLSEGLRYSALIIPRYEGTPNFKSEVMIDTQPRKEPEQALAIKFEEGPFADRPIRFCTLEVRVAGMTITCRQDFKLKIELTSILVDDQTKIAFLRDQDKCTYDLFAREDNESKLEAEKGYLSKAEADELVEISPAEEAKVELPQRSLDQYEIEEIIGAKPAPDSLQIVIMRSVFDAVQAIARNGAKVEEGGVLVGNVFRVPSASAHLVEISGHIFAEEARGTQFELRYTFESWQKRTAELREKFPGRRVTGWYHTHLLKAKVFDDQQQRTLITEHFFSSSDHFMHRQFFPEKWYVAMVLNPSGEAAFFQWSGNEIVRSNGFYVVKDEASPSD